MAKCKNCKHLKYKDDGRERYAWCPLIGDNPNLEFDRYCGEYKTMSQGDKIRNMSDEELADSNIYFVSEFVMKEGLRYTGLDGHYYKQGKEVYEANIIWLKSEVGCE